jgi:hypothetical protein
MTVPNCSEYSNFGVKWSVDTNPTGGILHWNVKLLETVNQHTILADHHLSDFGFIKLMLFYTLDYGTQLDTLS